jgi:hypothetical protein
MAKKSRRLPGGKVRKPLAQRVRPADATNAMAATAVADEVDDEVDEAPPAPQIVTPVAGARPALTPVGPVAATRPAPATRPAAGEPRRVGVGARRAGWAGGSVAPRRSTALMDLAAANYTHIRADLARIGILALIMLGIIVALSFLLK